MKNTKYIIQIGDINMNTNVNTRYGIQMGIKSKTR